MGFFQFTTRAQALAVKAIKATLKHIENITQIKRQLLQYIFKKAFNCGWHFKTNSLIFDGYFIDAPHTGKKPKITHEFKQQILKKITTG